jgi:hypothetical protein
MAEKVSGGGFGLRIQGHFSAEVEAGTGFREARNRFHVCYLLGIGHGGGGVC